MPKDHSSLSEPTAAWLDQANERIVVSRKPFALSELRCFPMSPYSDSWGARLRDGGRELVLDTIQDTWLFLWIVDVEEGWGRCRVSLPILDRIGFHYEVGLNGDTLWLITKQDEVIEVSMAEWKIRSWRHLRDFVPDDALVERVTILPGSRHVWMETSLPGDTYVVDLEAWTLTRALVEAGQFPVDVVGSPRPLHAYAEVEHGHNLYSTDGSPIPGSRLPIDYTHCSLARAPNGEGFISLELFEDEEAPEINDMIWHHLVAEDGAFKIASSLSRRVVNDAPHRDAYLLATSREAGLCFVLAHLRRGYDDKYLFAVSLSERGFRVRYRVRVPYDTVLAQDPEARRVAAVFTEGDALAVTILGRKRPAALESLSDDVVDWRAFGPPSIEIEAGAHCAEPVDEDGHSKSFPLSRDLKSMQPSDRRTVIGHYKAGCHDDAEELVVLYHALASMNFFDDERQEEEIGRECEEILDVLRTEHAEHPCAALTVAGHEASAGRWQAADRWLDVAEKGELEAQSRRHFHHLRALVRLHQSRGDEAFAELGKADEIPGWGYCHLDGLMELSEPMADPPEPGEWSPQRSMLRQLLGAIRTSNRAFEAADPEKAFAILDKPVYWQRLEVETAARRAAVLLEAPVRDEAERFRKRFVLARFCESLDAFRTHHIRLPGVTWDDERIRRIEQEARAWLNDGLTDQDRPAGLLG